MHQAQHFYQRTIERPPDFQQVNPIGIPRILYIGPDMLSNKVSSFSMSTTSPKRRRAFHCWRLRRNVWSLPDRRAVFVSHRRTASRSLELDPTEISKHDDLTYDSTTVPKGCLEEEVKSPSCELTEFSPLTYQVALSTTTDCQPQRFLLSRASALRASSHKPQHSEWSYYCSPTQVAAGGIATKERG
jgi:hypothetical protein